mgnify:FL=1
MKLSKCIGLGLTLASKLFQTPNILGQAILSKRTFKTRHAPDANVRNTNIQSFQRRPIVPPIPIMG